MDAVTYPSNEVTEFVNTSVVPVRIPSDAKPLADDFNLKWTPMLVVLDWNGKEHQRTIGFLPPEEFIPSVLLGIAKIYFDLDQFNDATAIFDKILSDYGGSSAAPEAMFFKGVCGYKNTHNPAPLKQAYEKLQAAYPTSEWTKRALPYRLLP
jgi:tetratricopeptide (TPR) repeat protein